MSEKENNPEKENQESIKYFVWAVGIGVAVFAYMHSNFLSISLANERQAQRKEDYQELTNKVDSIDKRHKVYVRWAIKNWGKKDPSPYPYGDE